MANRLAAEGHQVAVLDLDASACEAVVEGIRSAGGTALALGADVSDESSVAAAVELCAAELGAPTILINNAGIIRDELLFRMSTGDWDAVVGVHLRCVFLMTRACQRYMTEARWGRIVSMSSISALGNRGQANYSAAKAGIEGFTRSVALELGPFGITANAIAPGYIETDLTSGSHADPARREAFRERIPAGRWGTPADLGGAAVFLSSAASDYVHGAILPVDGGWLVR